MKERARARFKEKEKEKAKAKGKGKDKGKEKGKDKVNSDLDSCGRCPFFCVLRMHWVVNVDGAALDCQPRGGACNNVLCGCMPHKHTRLLLLILS